MPRAGGITAALLAKGKTAEELLGELAAGLDVAAGAELSGAVRTRPVFTVVIDALDEASDPPSVIEKVVSPLCSAASPGYGPRLLVATRRYPQLLGSLPASRVTVDLDQDAYRNDADVADYVTKVLLAAEDLDSPTPYRDQPELSRQVAGQVAAIAGHSFLIAQIAARTLARTPRALDAAEVAADRERWRDIGGAFDRDLDRYGDKSKRVRDLLTPLAWAEGTGLPRGLWAPLATALVDDQNYADDEIPWLVEQAGFYLVEALDQDRAVYRLYHEQLAEHLRAGQNPRSAHERICGELLRHVPLAAQGRREWVAATPYIRTHLATHAAKALVLDQLANDPGFLLAADPARLLPALVTVTDPEARKSATAFESTQHLLRGKPPGQAAAQLDLAARIHGATALADAIGHLPYKRPWTIAWCHGVRPDRHVLLGRHANGVPAIAATTLHGALVAVTGGRDGTLRLWDLRTGATRWKLHSRDDPNWVEAVATGEVDGIPVAVTVGVGYVQLWDLRTGAARGQPFRGDTSWVKAAAVGKVDGTPVAVTGYSDGKVQMWDLRTGAPRGKPFRGHIGGVEAAAVGNIDGIPVAVTSGHGTVRMWDLRTGAPRGKPFRGGGEALAVTEVDGTPVAVTGGRSGVRMWDLRMGSACWEALRDGFSWVKAVTVGEIDGCPVAVTGGYDGTVRVWDLRTGVARGKPFRGHTSWVEAVAVGDMDGISLAVTGDLDGTVRLWDLRTASSAEPLADDTGRVEALAVGQVDGTPVAVTGGGLDCTLRLWDLQTGTARWEALGDTTEWVKAVAVGEVDGTPVAVTGGGLGGGVRLWDLQTGMARGKPLLPGGVFRRLLDLRGYEWPVRAVAVGAVDGTPVAVTCSQRGRVRVWDLQTGAARRGPIHRRARGVEAVAVGETDGTSVAVTGDRRGRVQVWDLRTGAKRGKPLRGHIGEVEAAAVGKLDGTPVTAIGDNNGTVSMWALDCDQGASARLDAPTGISAIAFAGQLGWLTSTRDGSLFIWCPVPEHASPVIVSAHQDKR